jgi:hypothetical protein
LHKNIKYTTHVTYSPAPPLLPITQPLIGFSRVLISFKITDKNGTPISLSLDQLKAQDFERMEVVGVIGTILGKEGLFGQCGWFGDNDLDWMWVRIHSIKGVVARSDIRFRRG